MIRVEESQVDGFFCAGCKAHVIAFCPEPPDPGQPQLCALYAWIATVPDPADRTMIREALLPKPRSLPAMP